MNKEEKKAVKIMAKEVCEVIDHLPENREIFNYQDLVYIGINRETYNKIFHLLVLIQRAYAADKLCWIDYNDEKLFLVD